MSDKTIVYQAEQLSLIDDVQTATITLTRGEIESIKGWFNSLRSHLPGELVTADYHLVSKLYGATTMMEQATPSPDSQTISTIYKTLDQLIKRVYALESQIDEKIRDEIALALLDNGLTHL